MLSLYLVEFPFTCLSFSNNWKPVSWLNADSATSNGKDSYQQHNNDDIGDADGDDGNNSIDEYAGHDPEIAQETQ